jgi:hypothetical protein
MVVTSFTAKHYQLVENTIVYLKKEKGGWGVE